MKNIFQRRTEKYNKRLASNERKMKRKLRDPNFRDLLGLPKGMPPESLAVIAKAQAMRNTRRPPLVPKPLPMPDAS